MTETPNPDELAAPKRLEVLTREELSAELNDTQTQLAAAQEAIASQNAENTAMRERLARLEALASRPSGPTAGELVAETIRAMRLKEAEGELAALHPSAARDLERPRGHEPKHIPYKGMVQAKQDCAVGVYRHGPDPAQGRKYGDVFEVDVDVLWSDDPYEPVRVVGVREDGTPAVEVRDDVAVVDSRWRIKTDPESRNPIARAV